MTFRRRLGWPSVTNELTGRDVLILLPSLGTTSLLFDGLVECLSQRWPELMVIRADLPGHGIAPPTTRTSVGELADEVAGVVDDLQGNHVSIAGVSMGGAIALETARRRPDELHRFAMINSVARFGTDEDWRRLVTQVGRGGVQSTMAGAEEGWFAEGFRRSETARAILAEVPGIDADSYIACCRALAGSDARPGSDMISTPSVTVATSDDEATPPAGMRELSERLPRARYVELDRGRHLSVVERASVVADILTHTLGREGATA